MKTCRDYVNQHIKTETVDTINCVRYGRTGWFAFRRDWDNDVDYWGPLIVRVMQRHLHREWLLFGNRSTTNTTKLVGINSRQKGD